jgi:uncharacterized RDD family membrane protein YckC
MGTGGLRSIGNDEWAMIAVVLSISITAIACAAALITSTMPFLFFALLIPFPALFIGRRSGQGRE